jgi:hypothetical protein
MIFKFQFPIKYFKKFFSDSKMLLRKTNTPNNSNKKTYTEKSPNIFIEINIFGRKT